MRGVEKAGEDLADLIRDSGLKFTWECIDYQLT